MSRYRQALDRPIRTLTTLDRFGLVSGMGADTRLRMLQMPELRRAIELPDELRLEHGSQRERIRLLGNGVCLSVMQAIVESLTGSPAAAASEMQVQRNLRNDELRLHTASRNSSATMEVRWPRDQLRTTQK